MWIYYHPRRLGRSYFRSGFVCLFILVNERFIIHKLRNYKKNTKFCPIYQLQVISPLCAIVERLRWSRGSVLAFGTQVRGFKPGRIRRIFQGEKILSTPSFGGEVKPSVPCRRFTACKRSLHATWKSGISGKIHRSFLAHIFPPLATRISGETTSGESWNV